jgi:hypothetical protein
MPQSIFYDPKNKTLKKPTKVFQSVPSKSQNKYIFGQEGLECTIEDFDDSSSNTNGELSNESESSEEKNN